MNKLTVILPAAGKGSRLNLPYPKEILRFDKEKALIDNSFDLFDGLGREEVEFIVVINEEKTEIIKYLSKYKSQYNVSFTYQNPNEIEYTGAIKSAKHLFGENNIVLLPDTILTLPAGVNLAHELHEKLEENNFAFLFKPEANEKMLNTKGCLQLDNDQRVVDYEDKPSQKMVRFNGYWCAFAFKKEVFDECISFMEQSTLKLKKSNTVIEQTSIFGSKVIQVEDYKDLGTWEEVGKLLSKNHGS
jgi:NDP-sugar pyrophosphorylase family protein